MSIGKVMKEAGRSTDSLHARRFEGVVRPYPQADVALYLNTLLCQDPETWGGLRPIVEAKGWLTSSG